MKFTMQMGDKKVFIDTNILVYANFYNSPFHKRALNQLEKLHTEYELWISRQVIREYLVVKSRLLNEANKYTSSELIDNINFFEKNFTVSNESERTTNQLLALIDEFKVIGKQIHDCNIVATMLCNSIPAILTNNPDDFKRYDKLIEIIALAK